MKYSDIQLATAITKYDIAIGNLNTDIEKIEKTKKPLQEKKKVLEEKKQKLVNGLINILENTGKPNVEYEQHRYSLKSSPGSVVVPDVKKIPKAYWKLVKPAVDATKVKKAVKAKTLDPDKETWFSIEKHATIQHTIIKESNND